MEAGMAWRKLCRAGMRGVSEGAAGLVSNNRFAEKSIGQNKTGFSAAVVRIVTLKYLKVT
jgi:hypothetical protein